MSFVVQPGKLDNWTLELGPDMLRPFRCFRMESPARNVERKSLLVLFYGSDVIGSFGGSLDCFFFISCPLAGGSPFVLFRCYLFKGS